MNAPFRLIHSASFFLCLAVLAAVAVPTPVSAGLQSAAAGEEDHYEVARKASRSGELDKALASLQKALETDSTLSAKVWSEPEFANLLADNARRGKVRQLLRKHAAASQIDMVRADEEGERMVVSGTISLADGTPARGMLVYVYHTDVHGIYNDGDGNSDNPRLFAWLRTDDNGRYEVRSIRPASYPDMQIDQHVHYQIYRNDSDEDFENWRLGFSDDPYWNNRQQPQWAEQVTIDEKGVSHCTCDITLRD